MVRNSQLVAYDHGRGRPQIDLRACFGFAGPNRVIQREENFGSSGDGNRGPLGSSHLPRLAPGNRRHRYCRQLLRVTR